MAETTECLFETVVVIGKTSTGMVRLRKHISPVAGKVLPVPDAATASASLDEAQPGLVIVCESVSRDEAFLFLKRCKSTCPETIVVVVDAEPSVDRAVKFVRNGVFDYVPGPLSNETLEALVAGLKAQRGLEDPERKRFFSSNCPPGVQIVGTSAGMEESLETIRLVSESCCNPVLVLGETGSGKELAAQAVHAWRHGPKARFVAVNCAALNASLLESELFGHTKGAFTGADTDKTGLFELAGDGTIFLDEISEMPLELQAKLLRVLQERTFRRVGGTKDLTCGATIIASSNRDLLAEAHAGEFRKDLYYRLAVFPIKLPALRSETRRDDIPLLAEYFVENSSIAGKKDIDGLSRHAIQKLLTHDWPGNVRELKNVIDRAMILETQGSITPESLVLERVDSSVSPAQKTAAAASEAAPKPQSPKDFSLETAEKEFILRALQETGWQRTRAAALLGITRATLHSKLKRYDIQAPDAREKCDGRAKTASR
ncbi:MAG: sigma 54-interacting transcriptional regulator [Phycisphaerae bacterium]